MREAEFANAIGTLDQSVPHPRFAIYRNNVASALTNSLRVRYPVVEQLVGREFFGAMCREFILRNKPDSAMLVGYGVQFPEFISGFEPAEPVPYLADVARLESAWWVAYHAADTAPLNKDALAALAPEAWGETRLRFLPYVEILSFDYAAVSIWRAHHNDGLTMPSLVSKPEYVLIHREGTQVLVHTLNQDMHMFLNALSQSGTLLDAFEVASDNNEDFDIVSAVQQLFHLNIIAELYS
jgi:Putative DNA-binding domain